MSILLMGLHGGSVLSKVTSMFVMGLKRTSLKCIEMLGLKQKECVEESRKMVKQ
jgi:hypothetical protein